MVEMTRENDTSNERQVMAEKSQPTEMVTRRSAANALLLVGVAYVSAMVTYGVAAQFEHEWGKLGMAILAAACVPPTVLFFITQNLVRSGKAAGWVKLLTVLACGPLVWFFQMELRQLQWSVRLENLVAWEFSLTWGTVLCWITVAVLLSLQVRALILLGRWTACRATSPPPPAPPPDLSWMPLNQPLIDPVDSESPPNSQTGETQQLGDDHKPLFDYREPS